MQLKHKIKITTLMYGKLKHKMPLVCDAIYLAALRDNYRMLEMLSDHYEQQLMHNSHAERGDAFGQGALGKNAFHAAAINANHATINTLIKLVMPLGQRADSRRILVGDAFGCTPLHYAAIVARDEAMDPLLEMAQAESSEFMHQLLAQPDLRGRTPLHYAFYTNAEDILVNYCQRLDKIRFD